MGFDESRIESEVTLIANSSKKPKIGDFYWAYADILRGIGINESVYDQRILAFMALKLLVDNHKVQFKGTSNYPLFCVNFPENPFFA